ncbi:MAG TPA: type II secretion system F family protein [Vicinamibacterales bacterium]|jgi:type IV pilus assembly protein PilC|nr:type II secretion system F family protein [Vicinamibacterales bacterium]
MATFAYSGRTRAGQNVTGERVADSMEAAVAALRREQVMVSKINPVKEKAEAAAKTVIKRKKKVSPKSLAVFTRQFSVMIDAGLPLVQCLEILGTQEEDKNFGAVILETRAEVEGGASLADAMKKNPKVFDPLYTNMIAAGEAGGILDTILKRLATYIEKAVKLKNQVQSAMVYPVAIVVIATVVVGVILWKVIPTFANLFAGLGAELPLPTRVVIALSNGLVRYMPFVLTGIAGLVFGLRTYYNTPSGRMNIDRLMLKAPVFGSMFRKIAVARFCRTLATLLASGVSILEALDITAKTAGNAVVEQALYATRKSIEGGDTIAAPLKETAVFPPMVVQMISVGETTGALDTMLGKIADFYEEEVDVAVAGLLTLLEPLMIAVLGGVVGGIVIAMYMPIFSLISKLTGG